ncbi:MAG: ACT domain-containing protein [Candidatus Marinimicrobia bacterium]|nr:ACT domain-containing protein [Candidatus Neomarinimicrobiota bacterium]
MTKKILIPTKLDTVAADLLQANGHYTVVQDAKTDLLALCQAHADSYGLIVRSEKITTEVLDLLPQLKVVIRAGAGYNTIDTRACRQRGIDVMNTPGANANAVAEEAIALLLADLRHLAPADASTRAGGWEKSAFMGRELTGKTVGIVGLGAIGKLVARRLAGFEVKRLGFDPLVAPDRAAEWDVEMVDLPTLFSQSDFVTLHLPENADTRGLVNADLLERMKPGATLINCARAGIINEDDLRRVKAARQLRFLNDVYEKDAPGPKSVADIADLMAPHLGANTFEANANAARRAAEQLIEYDERGIVSYVVNRDVPAGLDEAFGELAYILARLCRALVGKRTQLKLIETSCYGSLEPFARWLLVPMVAALSDDFDRSMDDQAAVRFLKDRGIDYENREVDSSKKFTNSITVDMTGSVDAETLRHASVRGTVAEGVVMISRINDFDKLYFEPVGHLVAFIYEDRPGVLSQITTTLAAAGINIDDVRNPHDSKGQKSIAILKINQPVNEALVTELGARIGALASVAVSL